MEDSYSKFRLSEVLMDSYKLVRDEFCNQFLESIKPAFGEKIDQTRDLART